MYLQEILPNVHKLSEIYKSHPSGNTYPKQFVKISNNYSLLQNTILRFISCSHIVLVSNSMHKNIILAQIKELIDLKLLPSENKFTIFLEPLIKFFVYKNFYEARRDL